MNLISVTTTFVVSGFTFIPIANLLPFPHSQQLQQFSSLWDPLESWCLAPDPCHAHAYLHLFKCLPPASTPTIPTKDKEVHPLTHAVPTSLHTSARYSPAWNAISLSLHLHNSHT